MRCGCRSLRKPTLSKILPRLPDRSAVKLLAGTTCGCRQARPPRAGTRRRAPGRTRPQKFPSSPARHFAPGRGASQEARRPLAGSLSAGSPLLLPSSRLLPLHGCRTEPLNSHRNPPPPARRAGGTPAHAGAPGRADLRPAGNSPGYRFPALATHSHPPGAPRPPDPPQQPRCGETATLTAGAGAWRAELLTAGRRRTSPPPALGAGPRSSRPPRPPRSVSPGVPEQRGPRAVRVSWRGCARGCGTERRRRARGQLLPPRAAPPPSWRPASRAAAVSPAPRARRPLCPRHPLRGRTGLKGPDVCGRLSLAPAPAPAPSSPPCHTCTCCGSTASSARLNFYFDRNCGGGRRCGGRPGPAEAAGGGQDPGEGAEWGAGQSHQRLGAPCLFSFFPFFSLPPPGFKGTAPVETRDQAAAVSPVS